MDQEKNLKIITSHELLEMLPFGKTKFNQLLKAGELPLMKIGNDYITTESAKGCYNAFVLSISIPFLL